MTCANQERLCPDCGEPMTGRRNRKRCPPCGKKKHAGASYQVRTSDVSPWHCESSERPMFMTEGEALERRERVTAGMLLAGCSEQDVYERFGQSGINITRVRRRFHIVATGEHQLPVGPPVR